MRWKGKFEFYQRLLFIDDTTNTITIIFRPLLTRFTLLRSFRGVSGRRAGWAVLVKARPKFLHKVSPNVRWALRISVIPDTKWWKLVNLLHFYHFTHCNDTFLKIIWKVWTGIKYQSLMDISKLKEVYKKILAHPVFGSHLRPCP